MMDAIMQLKTAIAHNLVFVIESVFAWFLVCFGHIVGMTVEQPVIFGILPYIQFVVYLLAGATSIFTMYKIRQDLKKKK